MLLSLGFWHEQPCILLDVNDYPGIVNLRQQLFAMTYAALACCQLVGITSDPTATQIITRTNQLCGMMKANGTTLKYNLNQIYCINVVTHARVISANIHNRSNLLIIIKLYAI
jgi:hypothetical protein